MKPIKFHPQAETELAESVDFYNKRIPGLGNELFTIVKIRSQEIQRDPLRRPLRRNGTRKIKLPRFPYFLVYRDEPERILIIAVAHGARRPGYWQHRS